MFLFLLAGSVPSLPGEAVWKHIKRFCLYDFLLTSLEEKLPQHFLRHGATVIDCGKTERKIVLPCVAKAHLTQSSRSGWERKPVQDRTKTVTNKGLHCNI